jgi:anti-anti-sigma regulatory factor
VNISFDSSPDGTLIVVRGPLDVATATEFSMIVGHLLDVAGEHTVVDVTAVETKDAAGRAALRCVQRRMTEFGGLLRIPEETSG